MPANPRCEKLIQDAKRRITEISPADTAQRLQQGIVLIDVRETADFAKEHAAKALHLSRGVIELKIEDAVPDTSTPIVCYCGGGSRSALVADNLQKMGYQHVWSMSGGFKAWKSAGLPTET
jgi:rhodanese-related sulfurtransferase